MSVRFLSSLPNLRSLLDLLSHLLQLRAEAAVVNLALDLNHKATQQPCIGLLFKHHFFAGDAFQYRAQSVKLLHPQGTGCRRSRLNPAASCILQASVVKDDRLKMIQAVAIEK